MPFTGQATFDATIGAQGGNAIASAISAAFQRERVRQEQGGNLDMIVQHGRDRGLVSDEEWNRYQSAPPRSETRIGIGNGVAVNMGTDLARQKAQSEMDFRVAESNRQNAMAQRQLGLMQLSADQAAREGTPQPLQLPDGSVIPGRYYVPGARAVIDTNPERTQKPVAADSFVTLARDLKARTGADLGEWEHAMNKRTEGNDFVADFPKRSYIDETTGKTMSIGGTTRRIPTSTYQQFMGRVNAIEGGAGSAAPNPGVDPLTQARDAIGRGAPRGEVIKRLQAAGLDTSGL